MILTIKKAEFITASNGELSSLIEFPVSGKTKKRGFNALVINDHKLMKKCVKGVKLKLDFDDNMVINKIDVLTSQRDIVDLATVCPTCSTNYSAIGDKFFCKNVVCPSVSHGCLFKMLSYAMNNSGVKTEEIMLFLSKFAMKEGVASIDNLTELKMILNLYKDYYDTKPRLDNWVREHGDQGEFLYAIEVSLREFLVSSQMNGVFWSICNFPKTNTESITELSTVNPVEFLSGKSNISKFSKKTRKYLENNMDFIILLADVMSGVTWKY